MVPDCDRLRRNLAAACELFTDCASSSSRRRLTRLRVWDLYGGNGLCETRHSPSAAAGRRGHGSARMTSNVFGHGTYDRQLNSLPQPETRSSFEKRERLTANVIVDNSWLAKNRSHRAKSGSVSWMTTSVVSRLSSWTSYLIPLPRPGPEPPIDGDLFLGSSGPVCTVIS